MTQNATWDTHVHLFDPRVFPFAHQRSYTPGDASVPDLLGIMAAGNIDRAVVVQPSVYGSDNTCLLKALDTLGDRARGVAVADPATLDHATIAEMRASGVRGFRVNLVSGAEVDAGAHAVQAMASALAGSGMFLQIYAPIDAVLRHVELITHAGVPVVLDHFAGIGAQAPESNLIDLLQKCDSEPVWIKMSADYKLGATPESARTRAISLIRACVALRPDHIIWGSDWPHTSGGPERKTRAFGEIEPFRNVDSHAIPRLFSACGVTPEQIQNIMCHNPARLFDGQ
ncbi:amidohydrolase family protein [Phaeobacter sp. J2-8]|uniref:amidohydrolase family protein n=1 Tax=Phaeobacter sp. J2-8 TaxID=2931394 RepID=UPI001FD2511C|nr:amidohydrolase family protein [Phaeobacter sp. J2-8]MCJ7872811.1 amidohydrolase family protein [Phaeobacter sp. J2-8]